MKNVLFVCTGNTCRSCMAEAIFNHFCDINGFNAISAGVFVINDSKTSNNAAKIIKQSLNQDISNRRAVKINQSLIENSEVILTMTLYIKNILQQKFSKFNYKIFTLNEYVSVGNDIIDPFGSDMETYTQTYNQLVYSIKLLLQKLKEDTSIF